MEIRWTCYNCKEKFDITDTYNSVYAETYCTNCFNDCCFQCDDCELLYPNSESNRTAGRTVCDECDRSYVSCNNCGGEDARDNFLYCDDCGEYYCDDCYSTPDHSCATKECDFSLKPCTTKGKKIKIARYVGVEIEAENGERSSLNLPDGCGVTDDGSLNNGSEVTTPPRQMADFESILHSVTTEMKDAGFEIEDSCGLHVHLDASDFKKNYCKISQLFRTFYAVESIIYAMLPDERKSNSYCKPLARDYKFKDISRKVKPYDIDDTWYKGNIDKAEHHHDSRYHGLNLHYIFYRGTVEFRYHSGSLNEKKILNWVNFLLHATEYASKHYKYSEVIKLLKMKNNRRKFKYMIKVFKIDQDTAKYLQYRINLNSPRFFQQLKLDREEA